MFKVIYLIYFVYLVSFGILVFLLVFYCCYLDILVKESILG